MTWDTALVIVIVGVTAFFIFRWMYRKTKPSCHASCCGGGQCSNASTATIPTMHCHDSQEADKARLTKDQ